MKRNTNRGPWVLTLALASWIGATSCGDGHGHDHDHDHPHSHDGEGHVHVAPHGGTLVVLGEEFAHVEFTLDPETGELSAYMLSSHAENPIRLAQESFTLEVTPEDGGEAFELAVGAHADSLSDETVGDTSVFRITDERLVGLDHFEGHIDALTGFKGQDFKDVHFHFPEDEDHDHDHEDEGDDHHDGDGDGHDEDGDDH